jgi:hypothetical protein
MGILVCRKNQEGLGFDRIGLETADCFVLQSTFWYSMMAVGLRVLEGEERIKNGRELCL